jgi:diguanylate cyclase (GGDEF)-like protein
VRPSFRAQIQQWRASTPELATTAVAALLLALSAGAAAYAAGDLVRGLQANRLDDAAHTADLRVQSLIDTNRAAADRRAGSLAALPSVQSAFANHDVGSLNAIARAHPGVAFVLAGGDRVGDVTSAKLRSSITVYGGGGRLGAVLVAVPIDRSILVRAQQAAKGHKLRLLVSLGPNVLASEPPTSSLPVVAHKTARVVGRTYRVNEMIVTATSPPLVVTSLGAQPQNAVGLGWSIVAAVLVFAGALFILTRRSREEPPATPAAVRDAVAMVGETLAATHNPQALLPVILDAAIEATGAAGGSLRGGGTTLLRRGERVGKPRKLLLEDAVDGKKITLALYPPADGFGPAAKEAAEWIVAQGSIALENARLHGLVQRQAITDELTGLANRRQFMTRLSYESSRWDRSSLPLAVILADLDDFKSVNDRYGHPVGDRVLQEFAKLTQETVREIDVPARLGGEEFAILLPGESLDGGAQLANRLCQALAAREMGVRGVTLRVSASFGVACYPESASVEELLADADRCLYSAKEQGKNRVVTTRNLREAARP